MAIVVPRYEAPRVQEAATPKVRVQTDAPIEAFGGGQVVSGPTTAVNQLADVVRQEMQKANEIAVTEADSKVSQLKTETIYNPKSGLITKKGKDAFTAIGETEESFKSQLAKIEEGLSGDQKAMFRRKAGVHMADLQGAMNRHAAQEGEAYDNEVTNSRITNARDEAVLGYQEPGKVKTQLAIQQDEILKYAARSGKPSDWVKAKLTETHSGTVAGVIDRMLANEQDPEAREFYESHKHMLSAKDSGRVQEALKVGTLRGESQRKADEIVGSTDSLSAALAKANEITQPELRDETVRRVKGLIADRRAAKEDGQNQIFDATMKTIEGSKGRAEIPPGQWLAMSNSQRVSAENRRDQLRAGKSPVTDWEKYYDLRRLAGNDSTRDAFKNMPLGQYRHIMADAQFKELIDLQVQIDRGNGSAAKRFQSEMSMVDDYMSKINIDPAAKKGTPAKKVIEFRNAYRERREALMEQNGGKEPTEIEAQNILDNMVIKSRVKGTGYKFDDTYWFSSDKMAYETEQGERIIVGPSDIPALDRRNIERALKNLNVKPTDEAILRMYIEMNPKVTKE